MHTARELPPAAQSPRGRDRAPSGESVFGPLDWTAFLALTVFNLTAVGYALGYWVSRNDFSEATLEFAVLSLPLLGTVAMFELRWLSLPLMRRQQHVDPPTGWRVGVATTFVPGAEPIEMLEETVAALVAMDYPHETWVLDEGDDAQVRALCERLGAHHFTRKHSARHRADAGPFKASTKHGNYNAWLDEVAFERFDVVVAFDPDHVPKRHFLLRTLGHLTDPEVGYVQAAQVYYNQPASFIARGAAEETYAFYSSTEMTTNAFGHPIIIGCHNVHRVAALREVGGFAQHDADDLLITLYYRAAGWRGVYVAEELAVGLTPVDWPGYLGQQRRWARSVLDVKFRHFPKLARHMPPIERIITFIHGLTYLQGASTAAMIGLLCYMLASGSRPVVFAFSTVPPFLLMLASMEACNFWRQRYYIDRKSEWGVHWRARILHFAKWPYLLLALLDVAFPRRRPYAITAKVRENRRRRMLAIPNLLVISAITAAWATGLGGGASVDDAVHVSAALLVAASIALLLSELRSFPDPFDQTLARRRLHQPEAATTGGDSEPADPYPIGIRAVPRRR